MEPNEIPSQYQPQDSEDRVYHAWETSGFFNPDNLATRKNPFTIIMPPPNANGSLHIGHAVFVTLQDIMARYKRMRGFKTLWLPGADHAGFETQVVFDKKLEKEGRSRFKIPRDELYQEMLAFTLENKKIMEGQLRKLGASCDWSREKFTLDPDIVAKTQQAFVEFYNKGIVYRGERIINWCVKHQTALADLETSYVEKKDPVYYFQYGPFVIATARTETKFGDKYVVMHPKDKRYAKYKDGDTLDLEWINGKITATIIKDDAIDVSFGTGIMTITPWHDAVDFGIAERHKLAKEQIIDRIGRLLPIAGEFVGMKIAEARPLIVEKLKKKGLVVKVDENYVHNIATAERTGGIIEPQIKLQWFVDVNKEVAGRGKSLKELMLEPVRSGQIKIIPEHFEKTYFHWIENLRDWCISRQIWYGHRVPVWYKGEDISVGIEPKEAGWTQDEDTLDTWFSSGLWTFSTLGWPDATDDLARFHPTDVIVTAYEILFFWIARMILMTEFAFNDIPFHTVYITGMIRDAQGRKFSKSLDNGIDPIDIAKKFGTDAGRMSLVIGNTPGTDMRLSEDKIKGYKHFANKLWNIARFVLANASEEKNGSKLWPSGPDRDHFS